MLMIIQAATFSPLSQMKSTPCGLIIFSFLTRDATSGNQLDYSLLRNFLISASLIAPTNFKITEVLQNAISGQGVDLVCVSKNLTINGSLVEPDL